MSWTTPLPQHLGSCTSLQAALSPFCLFCLPACLPSFGHFVRLVSLLSFFVSGLVSLLVGHCVGLVSFLSPFVSPSCWSLCPSCFHSLLISLLVGHYCIRLVSLLSPVLSPFLLCPACLPVSFCFLLLPFLSEADTAAQSWETNRGGHSSSELVEKCKGLHRIARRRWVQQLREM